MQIPFDALKSQGVSKVRVGFTGGHLANPTYRQVTQGTSGHLEAVEVTYDADKITYARLLDTFWHNVDPTNDRGQFCDAGPSYRSAIFYNDDSEKKLAEASLTGIKKLIKVAEPIKTQILPAAPFYVAEPKHQDFYINHPKTYGLYKLACRRDSRLHTLWGTHE